MPCRFSTVRDLEALAAVLGCEPSTLRLLADPPQQAALYRPMDIPKKGRRRRGQVRRVYAVRPPLRLLQARIATELGRVLTFPPCV